MTTAVMAQDFNIETAVEERTKQLFIFYAGNLIAPVLRATIPEWRSGGLIRMDIITLQHRNGYIRQCEITDCRQAMLGIWKGNIHPQKMDSMKPRYKLTENGQTRVIEHKDALGQNDILFRPWYPNQDLDRVFAENTGIVQMPVPTADAARNAQLFLFPNWKEIWKGREQVPTAIRDLKAHFEERRFVAVDEFEEGVAMAAIRSCEQIEATGAQAVQRDNEMYDQAKVQGWAWNYGMDAQLYMEQLGIVRRDNLADQQASKIDRLADVLANAFGNKQIVERMMGSVPEPTESPATKESIVAMAKPVDTIPPEATISPDQVVPIAIGLVAVVDGRVGTITSMTKKTVTLEEPDGQQFTVPASKVEIVVPEDDQS